MLKIALDAGHGLKTAGKRCHKKLDLNQTREWWLNNRIAVYMEEGLKAYDAEVLRVDDRTGAKDISRTNRAKAANNFKADIYFSLHHNAAGRLFSGGGTVVYVWKKADAELLAMQKVVYNNLIAATGLKGNRATPLGKANFTVLVKTNMPAILVEHAFMDSSVDVPILLTDDFARKCAQANVKSLVEIYGLKKKEQPKEEPAPAPAPAFKSYKVKVKGDDLNIRQGPGTNAKKLGKIKPGVYTIVKESAGPGAKMWGLLKAGPKPGTSWIALDYVTKV